MFPTFQMFHLTWTLFYFELNINFPYSTKPLKFLWKMNSWYFVFPWKKVVQLLLFIFLIHRPTDIHTCILYKYIIWNLYIMDKWKANWLFCIDLQQNILLIDNFSNNKIDGNFSTVIIILRPFYVIYWWYLLEITIYGSVAWL